MPGLYGLAWTKEQLRARVGDMSQIAYARPCTLSEGKAKGVAAIDFSTGAGLHFTVLPDRALDISRADYAGRSLCWRSATGEVAPAYYQPEGTEWLHGFFGGLLTTCGLTYMGAPCEDEGQSLGLHGRVAYIPAREVAIHAGWEGDDYVVGVRGKVVEVSVFGPHLVLNRSIYAFAGEERLFIHDEVVNQGHTPAPHMMLYHINVGFPVLDEQSRFVAPSLTVTPRDAEAEKGVESYAEATEPAHGFAEQVFYHDLAALKDKTMVGVINPILNFGLYVAFRRSQLPHLVQWKMMGEGLYVMGLEPSTNYVGGRAAERAAGRLRMLRPGQTAAYDLEIGVLPAKDDVQGFEKAVKGVLGRRKTKLLKASDI